MSAHDSTQFFWTDWLGDQDVRRLTPAERGVWIDLIALAAVSNPIGYVCDKRGNPLTLDEIARVTHAGSVDEVDKLITGILEKGAASRDRTGRLFNRRMVRAAEKAAKKAAISAKRAHAGYDGAASTALKYFGKQILPKQVPRELTRHLPRETLEKPPPKKKKITSSETAAARAREGPARSLASALPSGALAREPAMESAEPPNDLARKKRPSDLSRTELEAMFAANKSKEKSNGTPEPATE